MDYNSLPWVLLPDGSRKINEELYDVINYVKPFLPENPVILEAGSSTGEDTIRFKETWPQSVIYCFEPEKSLFNKLRDKISGMSNINICNCALSNVCGAYKFNIARSVEISSLFDDNFMSIDFPKDVLDSVNTKREDMHGYDDVFSVVMCTTINQYFEFNQLIDFIWLDAEGAELKILQGASNVLSRVKIISSELNFQQFRKGSVLFDDLYKFMNNNNFKLRYIWGRCNWQGTGIFINEKVGN